MKLYTVLVYKKYQERSFKGDKYINGWGILCDLAHSSHLLST